MKKYCKNWNQSGKSKWLSVTGFSFVFLLALTTYGQAISVQQFNLNMQVENNAASIQSVIEKQILMPVLENNSWHCTFIKTSPFATYYTFQQIFNGIAINDAIIKTAISHQGKLLFINGNYFNTEQWAAFSLRSNPVMPEINLPEFKKFPANLTPKIKIIVEDNSPVYVYTYDYQFPNDRSRYTAYVDVSGRVLHIEAHRYYVTGSDTTVTAKVFLPDPLTTAAVEYGGEYMDNDDLDNLALNSEAGLVTMRIKFDDGIFYIQNDSVIIKDLNTPIEPVVTSTSPEFIFNRSESGFEDVNAFYHITNLNAHILNLGYTDMQNFYIEIDPHGASGADQSFYVSAAIPSIQFGEGGVDDAEDADVINHEYGHALSDHASPGTNTGLERRAIDEGYGDYFAASYSRGYSDFNWEKIFSWDGHNEFWFGRNANTNKHYPEDNSDNYYASCEIWSGALMDIFDAIGKDNTDKLVLEALHGSFPNMTMPEAAQLILSTEALIFDGLFYDAVFNALDDRGLINPVAITNTPVSSGISITNTSGYTFFNEPVIINFPTETKFSINCYSIDGKLMQRSSGSGKIINYQIPLTASDIILLEVITPDEIKRIKLLQVK